MIALVPKPHFSYFIEVGASSPEVSSTVLEQTWVCLIPLDLGSTGLVPHPRYTVQVSVNDCSNPDFSSTKGAGGGQGCTPPQAWESSKKEHQLSLPTPSLHRLLLSGPAVVEPESAPRDAVRVGEPEKGKGEAWE